MNTTKHCAGCRQNFYNGNNPLGVSQCWNLKDAKMVKRVLIHIDQMPPYRNVKPERVPSCYSRQRFIAVAPEKIGADGYMR